MKKLLGLALLLFASVAMAQSTTVSSTGVVDPAGTTWANGTYSITFQPDVYHTPLQYTWSGGALTLSFSGSLSGTGTFTQSVPANTSITPAGSKWFVNVCPNASAACYGTPILITGASLDVTSTLNSVLKNPAFSSMATPYGYLDAELLTPPNPGALYYNTTDGKLHCWTGSAWSTNCIAFGPSDIQITVGTTSIPANGCLPTNTTYNTVTITGLTTTMAVQFTSSTDLSSISGWTPSTPGLYFNPLPTANVLKWQICNASSGAIVPGSSTTWNVGVR